MTIALKYTILAGDQINLIAANLQRCKGMTVAAITTANPSVVATQLSIGQVINIPDTSSGEVALRYTIQSGDYYSKIADDINSCTAVTTQNILDANPGVTPTNIQIGEVINIPVAEKQDIIAPITVKTEDGQTFTKQLDINTTTLDDLKGIIEEQFNIPKDLQSIGSATIAPFEGDTQTLADFQIDASGASLGVLSHGLASQKGETPTNFKMILYYPSWAVYGRQFFLPAIDYSMVTHLNYAFADIKADGEVYMPDNADEANFASLKDIKSKYPHLKTVLSIGGWTYSTNFSATAATAAGREKFASTAQQLMEDNDFDGIDIDWEFPVEGGVGGMVHAEEDGSNFTLLLQALRSAIGEEAILTMTASPRPLYHQYLEIDKIKSIVSWMNLMSYDYHGAWGNTENGVTNFNAPLYESSDDPTPLANKHDLTIDASVRSLLTLGLPAKQLVVGLSFYGRGYAGVEPGPNKNGLYQTYWKALPQGSWPDAKNQNSGVFDWWDLYDNYQGKDDWQEYYHAQSQAAWMYSPSKKIFIAYDNPRTVWSKCAYIASLQLGGAMAWDASSDRYNQLLYVANYALKQGGVDAAGGPIPSTSTAAAGTAWSDETTANNHSAPISAISFAFTADGIIGLKTEYGTTVSPWRGSSKGRITRMIIPADRYITQFDIATESTGVTFKAIRIRFDNGTAFSIGMTDGVEPQYNVGTCASFLFYLSGKSTDEQLTELSCEFRSIPNQSPAPLHPLEDAEETSLPYQVAQAKSSYLNNYSGEVSGAALDEISGSLAAYDSPHFSFTVGSADCHYHTISDEGVGYDMGLQFESVHAQLVVGDPNDPTITIAYDGPVLSYGLEEEATFKNGQATVKLGTALAGVDMSAGKNGFTLDSSFGDVGETFEISPSQIKIGITEDGITEGLEINKNGIGVYFGIGGFTIDITVINIKALKSLEKDYVEIGKYLWKMAPVVFNAVAKGFGIVVKGVGDLFKSLFKF